MRSLIAATVFLCPIVAIAQTVPARTKKPPQQISIENGRKVALTAFEIMPLPVELKAGAKPRHAPKALLKLDAPLPPGESTMAKLAGAKGCSFLARWTFEDVGDEGPVDLCGDPKIVLTD